MKNKCLFWVLWLLCLIGSWTVLPYIQHLGLISLDWKIFWLATLQAAVFYGIICFASYKLLPRTDLHPFQAKELLKRIIAPGIIAGVLAGAIIFFLDRYIFHSVDSSNAPPFWMGALASFYGAVNEEVMLRIFLFTGIYFLLRKAFSSFLPRGYFLWITNIIVALVFGLGHLPLAFQLTAVSVQGILRVLVLNGIGGILFGWLYWSKSLWAAMAAHFIADIVIRMLISFS
ncbi:MAG: CPBP family intramembrane metalloprotease [Simkaniaceae bacterium]